MNDDIKKIDEEIENLKNRGKHEHVEEKEEKETDTKKFDIDNYEEEVVEDEDTKEIEEVKETREERLNKEEAEEKVEAKEEKKEEEKPKKKKKIWPFILIGIIVLIIIIIVVVLLLLNRGKEEVEVDTKDTLSSKEQKEVINGYGEAIEKVISVYYNDQNVLLKFDDAAKLVNYDYKVKCSTHEVYEDGKVYLNKCKIDGVSTKYSYGEEQKEIEFNEATSFKVYYDKTNKKASLEKITGAKEYIVNTGGKFSEVNLLSKKDNLQYVEWMDEEYKTHVADYTTGKEVLANITYSSCQPIHNNSGYTSYAVVTIGDKCAIYNYVTGDKITSTVYDYARSFFGLGVSGPAEDIPALEDTNNVVLQKGNSQEVVDFTSGQVILSGYNYLATSGNYLVVGEEYNSFKEIYDFDGNRYFQNKYEKIYDLIDGKYMLINQDDHILLVNTNGTILNDFGSNEKFGSYNFGLKYNDGVLFQIGYEDNENDCIELIYSKSSGSEKKTTMCGGIAKPILYLYPKKTTNVTVSFEHPEYLETTYPKFTNKWSVKAHSNGDLYDKDNKYYYGLYWDEKKVHSVDFSEGFYVEADDAIEFLEEKLTYIGLNDKERNEFITYWLPVMEKNKKNLVYFELTDERESYNKINISPKPDTLLRLVIHIKKVNKKVDIPKESLTHTARRGFVAVEWGGTTY